MGNIDDPSSEAYRRFGAGRGAMPAPDTTPYSETADARNLMKAATRERAEIDTDESGIGRYARETGIGTMRQPAKPATKAKAPIVTKEQMQKAGFDNLRDYLNAQKGLKRRSDTTPKSSTKLKRKTDIDVGQLKKGGKVSASKRADGIVKKGKTRGRFV